MKKHFIIIDSYCENNLSDDGPSYDTKAEALERAKTIAVEDGNDDLSVYQLVARITRKTRMVVKVDEAK